MNEFLKLSENDRKEVFKQAAAKTGLPVYAIEKDWWVTQLLRIIFSSKFSSSLIFKGGTSLSKAYSLITRFSEDIDLGIDRVYFKMDGELTRNQIKTLRKKSSKFISGEFFRMVIQSLIDEELPFMSISIEPYESSDTDPSRISITYKPLVEHNIYILPRILLEISCRSLKDPNEERSIQAIIDREFAEITFAKEAFSVSTVSPERTFLEKIFLLHEEWQKQKIRIDRLSRHLYDLERIMDTEYGAKAFENSDLYNTIIKHRERYTNIRGVDYSKHIPKLIKIVPPNSVLTDYEKDYSEMSEHMFVGENLSWKKLIERLKLLESKINSLNW